MHAIRIGFAALATVAVLGSGCGSSASGHHGDHTGHSQATPVTHNAADVAFAKNMIPHHQQAVDMAAMVPSRTADPRMHTIAKDISTDQQAEIHAMTTLLEKWGESGGHDPHAGHGMPPMQGMVDAATMNQLQSLSGNAFDELWMRSMIAHHQGAVAMAQDEIAHGQNQDAVHMAKNIVFYQQREIAYMTHLLSATE